MQHEVFPYCLANSGQLETKSLSSVVDRILNSKDIDVTVGSHSAIYSKLRNAGEGRVEATASGGFVDMNGKLEP
jgi:hypothetical protein